MGIPGRKHQIHTSNTQFRKHTVNMVSLCLTLGGFWDLKAFFSFSAFQISFSFSTVRHLQSKICLWNKTFILTTVFYVSIVYAHFL